MAVSSEVRPVAGKKIYIGGAMTPSDSLTNSSFSSQTWTQIKGWETAGAIGDSAATITVALIDTARDTKVKGTKNAGSMTNNFARLNGDAGQTALIAAAADNQNYAFKIEGNEAGATTVSQLLFVGLPMSTPMTGGNANTADMMSCNIEVNSNIVKVAAT